MASSVLKTPAVARAPAYSDEELAQRRLAARVLAVTWGVFAALALLLIAAFDRFGVDTRLYGLAVPLGALILVAATAGYARVGGDVQVRH